MKPIPSKAEKLLALALDSAAHDGEWKNAAVMFVASLRKAGTTAQDITSAAPSPPPSPQWYRGSSCHPDSAVRMPFGKHKGAMLRDIPTDYLEWLFNSAKLRPYLKGCIKNELGRRNK